ncbi:MAG: hypothetical protein RTU63_01380 [Candidatus Thorarchaeota archaeon]
MSEEPIVMRSPLPYQIAIFLIVNVWAIMCFEMALYQLVDLVSNQFSWLVLGTILLWSMTPILTLCAWKLKERVEVYDPVWDVKIREVSFEEFEKMMKNYNSKYRHMHTSLDLRLLFLVFVCHFTFFSLPFYTMFQSFLLISITPALVALVAVPFGLLFSYFIFKLIPTSATREFPRYSPRRFRNTITFLHEIPGIYWAGIRLSIGEVAGYYTIRDPIPIARIEGIEGAARIECAIDSSEIITRITPIFETEGFKVSDQVKEITPPYSHVKTAKFVHSMLTEYIRHSGGAEILEDVLEDIDTFLRKHESQNKHSM